MRKDLPFECVAMVLQGGGALGSYQAGVYEALAQVDLHPDWVSGISIGSINSALIAGNAPENRVQALRSFWELITKRSEYRMNWLSAFQAIPQANMDFIHTWLNQISANEALFTGAPGFFTPRSVPPFMGLPGTEHALSFYDTSLLRSTLERLVDFDRINSGQMRFSVGAVQVSSGNFVYFDNTTHTIDARHVMASGALPPGFPAVEIDGEYYWDGGVVSNTPLRWVLDSSPAQDTLAFQVDLWSASGDYPTDLISQEIRLKDIRFSSRTRYGTDQFRNKQGLRRALYHVLQELPDEVRNSQSPDMQRLLEAANDKSYNIVQLIYRAKNYEGDSKDYEFSRSTMEEHWAAGYNDAKEALAHQQIFELSKQPDGVSTFDLHTLNPESKE
ncbi:MAG TPA: patatin-like phospholipase family protein [Paenalcaligenes sp.]|nr:patatin-like phospholipase family protein [Paenalcaligenes sp.]